MAIACVALHVTMASPSLATPATRRPGPAHLHTYPHRLPQLARRQSHFTPTKLRKWQANEQSGAYQSGAERRRAHQSSVYCFCFCTYT